MAATEEKRGPGRPRKADAKRYTTSITTTLEMKNAIRDAAERSGRSMTQEIELRLERSFRDDDVVEAVVARLTLTAPSPPEAQD